LLAHRSGVDAFAGDVRGCDRTAGRPVTLHEAALATADDGFGGADDLPKRMPAASPLEILRYYDVNRDFQPGPRASAEPGQPASIELPAADRPRSRGLIDNAARRAG
jgi:hypothetical protein